MKIINIGVLAHVDAGKTTLTEQILYQAGIIKQAGTVDKGTTITDSLAIERRRGITVKAAAVSFTVGDLKVNLLDTPGHADFISEVEHSLSVLDGAILVISAVEGVQAQTRVLMQALKDNRIPTLLYMNKLDRVGADYQRTRAMIQELLTENICDMNEVFDVGSPSVTINHGDPKGLGWIETLALQNDALLLDYTKEISITGKRLHAELGRQAKSAITFPLFAGSAAKGKGVGQLLTCLEDYFPVHTSEESKVSELSGLVFKVIKNAADQRLVYVRLYSGQLRVRDEIPVCVDGNSETFKLKRLLALQAGTAVPVEKITAGDIAILPGAPLKVGDILGTSAEKMKLTRFPKPPIQVKVSTPNPEDDSTLHQALSDLTDEDPFLQYYRDGESREKTIRVFGKIQQEILAETIQQQYGLGVSFSPPKVICIERPVASGEAVALISDSDNPFRATIGLRVEPGPAESGLQYRLEAELGSLLLSFQKAIKDSVEQVLQEGLYGWAVTDIIVTLTDTGYDSVLSTAKDFRSLTPLVLMEALQKAGTCVYEPVNSVQLLVPEISLSKVVSRLAALEGTLLGTHYQNNAVHIDGTIPVRTSEALKAEFHSLTRGQGMISIKPGGYVVVQGDFPENQRRQINPLNRGEYMLQLNKVVQ
ncbi:MAG: TetM/TetW/TetO/TetS family tetracycline resistance ribosomal protection protein [Firmicutes bacterium]|nr:TetM/TetW/TetO/TetS family tetracycline resistance ribosomal protection protein [Bacillota bacterium]